MRDYLLLLPVIFGIFIFICLPKIHPEDAADAIVGEASNQDFYTQICVAQGIRHRGTLKGVNGFHAHHNRFETSSTYMIALDAWDQSLWETDKIKGAKNWGSWEDISQLNPKIKARCGDLYFY